MTTPTGERPHQDTAPPRTARLHPLTFVVGAIREMLALLVAGAAGLAVGGLSTAFYFTLVGLLFGFAYHIAGWATFTYTVHEDRIELRRVLVGRSVKNVPRERIRGVDISSTLTHRLLGLAIVHIDAGSEGGEGSLNAVSRGEAERLRALLLDRTNGEPGPAQDSILLARSRPRWYLLAPLSGAYLFTPFALAGSALGALYNLGDEFGLITERRLSHLGSDVGGLPPWTFIGLVLVVLIAMPVGSVIVFGLLNWDFTLRATAGNGPPADNGRRDGAALVAARGLITRRSVTLEHRRIRGVELQDNLLERVVRVRRLSALVTGLGDAAQRGTLLPPSPRTVTAGVAARVLGGGLPGPLLPHPPAARSRRVVRAVSPPLGVAALALLAGQPWVAGACLIPAALAVPLGIDRYRQLGHTTDGHRLAVRSGSLRRRQVVIEHRAVVAWRLRQTLFQRRLKLATLIVGVGAGDGGYPAIDMSADDAIAFAHQITPPWLTPFLTSPTATDAAPAVGGPSD
jgi:putative membrane protein